MTDVDVSILDAVPIIYPKDKHRDEYDYARVAYDAQMWLLRHSSIRIKRKFDKYYVYTGANRLLAEHMSIVASLCKAVLIVSKELVG
jgi:hypothetical protein